MKEDIIKILGPELAELVDKHAAHTGVPAPWDQAAAFATEIHPKNTAAAVALAAIKVQQLAGLPARRSDVQVLEEILKPTPAPVVEPAAEEPASGSRKKAKPAETSAPDAPSTEAAAS